MCTKYILRKIMFKYKKYTRHFVIFIFIYLNHFIICIYLNMTILISDIIYYIIKKYLKYAYNFYLSSLWLCKLPTLVPPSTLDKAAYSSIASLTSFKVGAFAFVRKYTIVCNCCKILFSFFLRK